MIESFWRALKHQWLYLNTLDEIGSLEKLIFYYATEHNTTLPHSAFRGQTPDEMYFGKGAEISDKLAADRKLARQARMESNRKRTCPTCEPVTISN